MPSHHLSASHTSAKISNEVGLSLSPASALLIAGDYSSADYACVAHIGIDRTFRACPENKLGLYTVRMFARPEWPRSLNAPCRGDKIKGVHSSGKEGLMKKVLCGFAIVMVH